MRSGIQRGTADCASLYIWKPIPHSARFVALGMVATTTGDPPPLEAVHCVPRKWVIPTTFTPTEIWNDAGSGGRAGSLWVVNEYRPPIVDAQLKL